MAIGKNQFTGAAGQYFVSYGLAARQIHATITLGNAPCVDVLCSSPAGDRLLSIQVKTSRWAAKNSYGEVGYNWDVGLGAAGKSSEQMWYALVDLRDSGGVLDPIVYFVPSKWVGLFVERSFSRGIFYLKKSVAVKVANNWDYVSRYLSGDSAVAKWAASLDPDFRWWRSKDPYSSGQIEEMLRSGWRLDENNCLVK